MDLIFIKVHKTEGTKNFVSETKNKELIFNFKTLCSVVLFRSDSLVRLKKLSDFKV